MNYIGSVLSSTEAGKALKNAVKDGKYPIAATGLSPIHRAVCISVLEGGKTPAAVICADEADATRMCEDLISLGINAALLPFRDISSFAGVTSSHEWEHKRLNTLSSFADGAISVCVGSVAAFTEYTLPPERLTKGSITLSPGKSIKTEDLAALLVAAGYTRTEQVEGPAQFALRGGIFDIFVTNDSEPVRIEFWGDEIDTVSHFDVISQRRTTAVDSVFISPAREALAETHEITEIMDTLIKSKRLTEKQKNSVAKDKELLKAGVFSSFDRYLPYMYDRRYTALDYLKDGRLYICDSAGVFEKLRIHSKRTEEEQRENTLKDDILPEEKFSLGVNELQKKIENGKAVLLETFARAGYNMPLSSLIPFSLTVIPPWRGGTEQLIDLITKDTVILTGNEKSGKLLCDELAQNGIPAVWADNISTAMHGVTVTKGGLSSGLSIPQKKFSVITHSGALPERKRKHFGKGRAIGSLEELKHGDYVVHAVHGIGVFGGIKEITNNGIIKDYIKIEYAKGDSLYVPVTQLDLVSKYIGNSEDGAVRLNKLGGSEWQKTKSRVKSAVKDMAKQLTALYAKRMSIKGFSFSPDTDMQSDFERRFQYDETEDQLRCIGEIKDDMEKAVPMDRLLCGDVGFGKTEVALRAAFKCICDGKQCLLMAPTTILAWQHYNTVISRFGDFPVEVRLLSRFVSKKEQAKTVAELKRGSVDMVIGTHRLISSDIRLKNPGLIIIDEEHRFGVAQKEKLKEVYPTVDVLTLSATPIPRTLNMAMSGLRDMSSIDEAPEDRLPVQTFVIEEDREILLDAIDRELRRGGQVYYLHNRVESITACAARLQNALPDARVGIAHGKMDEEELSAVWRQLIEHEIDILVCTTIIETGVDVPNANTLIIEDADRMGLSQLHQLRGRVGRSPRRAYAYFCFKRGKALTEIAEKRLTAIREYTEFGSGFKIAMRDLEIRGAGSVLGGEQHGHLEAVGYDMYVNMLKDAIKEENGEEVKPENNCVVDVDIAAHIPENYIPHLPQRLAMYHRIADIRNEEDASDVIDELCDRFGDPPKAVMGLIDVAQIRNRAAGYDITEIGQNGGTVLLYTDNLSAERTGLLISELKSRFMLSAGKKPYYAVKIKSGQTNAECLKEVLAILSKDVGADTGK